MIHEIKNSSTNSVAYLESIVADALQDADACQFSDQAVCIHIHSIRKRPTDPDGVSAKAAIDGIVEEGLLADDNCEIVKSVTFSQEKTKGEEMTIIEINVAT